uniref:Cuticle protein n=1 Tax=Heliothis virescens TaxID=7102 RepID=A0A2A4JMP9_HELVI
MKTIAAVVLLVAFASAEPPPSNSYLPPPSSSRGAGYPQGPQGPAGQSFGPQIVAARTLDGPQGRAGQGHGAHGGRGAQVNGLGRSAPQDHGSAHARLGGDAAAGYDHNAAAFARNALEEINAEPANYNFGYMVNDYQEGTDFGHHEERQEERAQGEYHVVLPDGRKQTVSYEADERGFKPQISYEDSEDLGRSGGYDSNANNARSNQVNGYANHGNHEDGHHGNHGNGNARSNGY